MKQVLQENDMKNFPSMLQTERNVLGKTQFGEIPIQGNLMSPSNRDILRNSQNKLRFSDNNFRVS